MARPRQPRSRLAIRCRMRRRCPKRCRSGGPGQHARLCARRGASAGIARRAANCTSPARAGPRLPDRPGLTAARFIACPFGPPGSECTPPATSPAGPYRGDRVRGSRRPPGQGPRVPYRARRDGDRACRPPGVADAAVIAREDEPGVKRLTAYVVPATSEPARPPAAGPVAATLPDYRTTWCRSAFVRLDALPLSRNGKLDRRALPAPEAGPATGYTPPRTATERALAGIWAEVLGVAPARRHPRQLLRARRGLHPVHPGRLPRPAGGSGPGLEGHLHAPDHCRTRRGGYRAGAGGG